MFLFNVLNNYHYKTFRSHKQWLRDHVIKVARWQPPAMRVCCAPPVLVIIILWRTDVIGAGFDLCIETVLVLIPERRISDEQDVQDHS